MADLLELQIIEIRALIVIAQDRAAAPIRMASAILVLQAIPQRYKPQSPGGHYLRGKADCPLALTGAAPDD